MNQRLALLLLAALVIQSCGQAENPARQDAQRTRVGGEAIAPGAVDMAMQRVLVDLNEGPAQVTALLRQAAAAENFPIDALQLQTGEGDAPLGGWAAERGLLTYVGEQYGRHFVSVAQTLAPNDLEAPWYSAAPAQPQAVQCHAGVSLDDMTCAFVLPVAVTVTAIGAKFVGQQPDSELRYAVTMRKLGTVWTLEDMSIEASPPMSNVLDQLIGPSEVRAERNEAAIGRWLSTAAQGRAEADNVSGASTAELVNGQSR